MVRIVQHVIRVTFQEVDIFFISVDKKHVVVERPSYESYLSEDTFDV